MSADAMLLRLIADDELYCAKNLKIRTKEGKVLPFIWNDAQRILHAAIEEQKAEKGWVRIIVLKGRQQGISTYVAARFYKKTSMAKGKRTMILTHLDSATKNLFGMAKTFYEQSASVLRPAAKANSSNELSFGKLDDSGYKVATAGSPAAGRSGTIQYLHASEMAFYPNAQEIMAGLGQSLPLVEGTEGIIESTANGLGNLFHEYWVMAESGKSDYKAVFIPWFADRDYRRNDLVVDLSDDDVEYMEAYGLDEDQMSWRAAKISTDFAGDQDWFNQEYPATVDLAFQRIGHRPLINTIKVSLARKRPLKSAQRIGAHVVGLDPGRGGDPSSFIHRQGRVAWGLERNTSADTMAVAGQAARMLREDPTIRMMFIDIGGIGAGVYDRLVELGFGDRVTAVNFGGSATDDRKYFNKRCEMWGEMAEWIHDDITPCIPDDDRLHGDLTSARGDQFSSNGQLKLDKKEVIKKTLRRSPDDGDALALTFAEPVAADDIFTEDWKAKLMRRNSRKSAMGA
mgnify:CR=1 FL=1